MRILCSILVLLCAIPAPADVIHLKNGRTIWADQVREDNSKDRVEYDMGEDTYAIPKSSIERIDAGGAAPVRSGAGQAAAVRDFTPAAPAFEHEGDIAQKIVHDGKVDAEALAELERAANSDLAATGYFLAGKYESDLGNFPQASRYYDTALRFQPNNATFLFTMPPRSCTPGRHLKLCLMPSAQSESLPSRPIRSPCWGSFSLPAITRGSDSLVEKSLTLRPDATVSQYLEKAERESKAESEFSQRESSHFNLHFEGKDTSAKISGATDCLSWIPISTIWCATSATRRAITSR